MKIILAPAIAACALSLAACGDGAAGKLAKACERQGALSAEACRCVSAKVATDVSPAALKALALQAENRTEGTKAVAQLSMQDQQGIMSAQMTAIAACQK